jgi:hypothetical protein
MDGQPFEDFLQQLIAGITNLPAERVFPRWQEEPVPKPPFGTDWAAVGPTTDELDRGWPVVTMIRLGTRSSSANTKNSRSLRPATARTPIGTAVSSATAS